MYEISEADRQDYKRKWLEAEYVLAASWIGSTEGEEQDAT